MSTNTTNMSMGKAVDGDNSRTYIETTLGAALDKLDAHAHGTDATGLAVTRGSTMTVTGGLGIGVAPATDRAAYLAGNNTVGTTQYGLVASPTMSSAATVAGRVGYFSMATAAAAFTLTDGAAIYVGNTSVGAASFITVQSGIHVTNQGVSSGTGTAYGVWIDNQANASTNIGLKCDGTVQLTSLGARQAGDLYVIVDASGNLHKSAIGPAS